jgi:NAD(P)-dependent dehydrogenase (short-subunit alcohol dehydrogenase family)
MSHFQASISPTYSAIHSLTPLGPPSPLRCNIHARPAHDSLQQRLGKSGIKSIIDITIDDFEQTWRTNCGTAFLLTQLCIPAMEEKGWGRVIFCSSVAGFTGGVVGPHYA